MDSLRGIRLVWTAGEKQIKRALGRDDRNNTYVTKKLKVNNGRFTGFQKIKITDLPIVQF